MAQRCSGRVAIDVRSTPRVGHGFEHQGSVYLLGAVREDAPGMRNRPFATIVDRRLFFARDAAADAGTDGVDEVIAGGAAAAAPPAGRIGELSQRPQHRVRYVHRVAMLSHSSDDRKMPHGPQPARITRHSTEA
jgi:hypothetical protein